MHLLFSILKVLFRHSKSIVIKTEVKIPILLLSILGQSATSRKPMQIYLKVGVSLLRSEYPAALKNFTRNVII